MYKLGLIKDINIGDKSSWSDKIFITLDVDWAQDYVLSYTLDILEKYDLKATIFATHTTPLLDNLRYQKNVEIGIHPNFNFLLDGDYRYGNNFKQIIEYYLSLFPDAKSVRSHSMTQNTPILRAFSDYGLKFESNHFLPYGEKIQSLAPYLFWDKKLLRVPYFWEDDINLLCYEQNFSAKEILRSSGLKVFDFHPIHLYLNTSTLKQYQDSKSSFNKEALDNFINTKDYGTRDFFVDLMSAINNK